MFVAATTLCYPHLTLSEAIEKLAHLEFSHIELDLHETGGHIKPAEVLHNLQWAYDTVNTTRRLTVVALNLNIEAEGEAITTRFACCELAKFSKIVTLTVASGMERRRKRSTLQAVGANADGVPRFDAPGRTFVADRTPFR